MSQILARCYAASPDRRVVGGHGRLGRRDAVRRRVGAVGVDLRGGREEGEGDVGGGGMGICAQVSFDSCCVLGREKKKERAVICQVLFLLS